MHPIEDNYVTALRFINDSSLLVSYGSGSICLWDLLTSSIGIEFFGHEKATTCISHFRSFGKKGEKSEISHTSAGVTSNWDESAQSHHSNNESSIFLSGSADATVRVWDVRMAKHVSTITGHTGTINSLDCLDYCTFVSASDDGTVRLTDIRCMKALNVYDAAVPVTSTVISKTGRFVFGGCDDYTCRAWDTVTGDLLQTISGHEGKVSCIGMAENGSALCTASWDTTIRVCFYILKSLYYRYGRKSLDRINMSIYIYLNC